MGNRSGIRIIGRRCGLDFCNCCNFEVFGMYHLRMLHPIELWETVELLRYRYKDAKYYSRPCEYLLVP